MRDSFILRILLACLVGSAACRHEPTTDEQAADILRRELQSLSRSIAPSVEFCPAGAAAVHRPHCTMADPEREAMRARVKVGLRLALLTFFTESHDVRTELGDRIVRDSGLVDALAARWSQTVVGHPTAEGFRLQVERVLVQALLDAVEGHDVARASPAWSSDDAYTHVADLSDDALIDVYVHVSEPSLDARLPVREAIAGRGEAAP